MARVMTPQATMTAAPPNGVPPPPGLPDDESPRARFRPSREAEARILLLIDAFSRKNKTQERYLEGRIKLAKLDFLLRYPRHLRQVLLAHGASPEQIAGIDPDEAPLDARMMRYRYGPWDPSYYAVLGSLIGRGLVDVKPLDKGFGYRTSVAGAGLAAAIRADDSFDPINQRLTLLRRYLDRSGNVLKNYLYEIPEIVDAAWHEDLT
ncbi:hypothetical protein ADL15_22760 [Actinoplanes awajinensis subsp. mycoplanecinus]|uniref:Uncharacterized protein n=2 Tax=Actinoplanes awajinensis TaxID=135946 RepID=A0A117MR70_9ACTN|nr:hypothetical protein ADL15_22760 [Actinoplanes awajinensis subsp. mycoplanecinus]